MLPSAHAPGPPHHPFDGTDRLIIDGTNLLYRLGRVGRGGAARGDRRAASAAAVPPTIAIDLVFDGVGHGVYGRVAQKMYVRYSGRRTADDTILDLGVRGDDARRRAGGGRRAVLVVTNDRGLRDRLAAKGARTAPLQWFIGRLDVPAPASPAPGTRRPGIGAGRPPGTGAQAASAPGRRRTARAGSPAAARRPRPGPPNKVARHKRHPRARADRSGRPATDRRPRRRPLRPRPVAHLRPRHCAPVSMRA